MWKISLLLAILITIVQSAPQAPAAEKPEPVM